MTSGLSTPSDPRLGVLLVLVTVAGIALLVPAAANHSPVQDDPWEGDDEFSREGSGRDGFRIDLAGDTAISGSPREGSDGGGDAVVFVRDAQDDWTQQALLTAPDTERFGWSVALDGDTALVGDLHGGSEGAGAAFVFTREETGGWTKQARLEGEGVPNDGFGESLDLHGDTAVVGAPALGADEDGSAFVFERGASGEWSRQARLQPPSTHEAGAGVALQGDRAVVGAPGYYGPEDDGEPPTGAAFVYERGDEGAWIRKAVLTGERPRDLTNDTILEPDEATEFGESVGLDGSTVAVGDPEGYATTREFLTSLRLPVFDDRQAGALYTFTQDDGAWSQEARLFENRGPFPLGRGLDLDGHTLVPGRVPDPPVFALDEGTWSQEDRLTVHEEDRFPNHTNATGGPYIGPAGVAVDEGRILAGGDDPANVFEFERTG